MTPGRVRQRLDRAAAIEEALRRGPVHLIKRNRRAAVILSEQQYQQLMSRQATGAAPKESAVAWLLSPHGGGERSKAGIDEALRRERDW